MLGEMPIVWIVIRKYIFGRTGGENIGHRTRSPDKS